MHPIAYYAVAATILASALGAFLLCVLVFRYGFEPPEDEVVEDRHRRYFVTRLGHAGGAVCFAITAGLAAVALGMPARTVAGISRPEVTRADVAALRASDSRLDKTLRALGERMTRTETAITDVRAEAARAMELAKIERAPAPRPVTTVAPAEKRRAPVAKDDAREIRTRPTTTRRPEPRASAVEPAPTATATAPSTPTLPAPATATGAASAETVLASPVTSEPTPEPEKPPVRLASAVPNRPAAVTEQPPAARTEPRSYDDDDGPGVGQAISRVGSEIGRTLARFSRDVRRFVEDLR